MKTEQIIILVVSFFLGILLLNTIKGVCGCDLVEGAGDCENEPADIKKHLKLCENLEPGTTNYDAVKAEKTINDLTYNDVLIASVYKNLAGNQLLLDNNLVPGVKGIINRTPNIFGVPVNPDDGSKAPPGACMMDELLAPDGGGPFGSIMSDLFREDGGSRKVWEFCGALPPPRTEGTGQTCDAWSVENLEPDGENWNIRQRQAGTVDARCTEEAPDKPFFKSDRTTPCSGACSVNECCEAGCPVELEVTGPLAVPVPAQIKHGVNNFGALDCAHPGTVEEVELACLEDGGVYTLSLVGGGPPCPPAPTCSDAGYDNNMCQTSADAAAQTDPTSTLATATLLRTTTEPCPAGGCTADYCCTAPDTCDAAGYGTSAGCAATAATLPANTGFSNLILSNPAGTCAGTSCQLDECCMGFLPENGAANNPQLTQNIFDTLAAAQPAGGGMTQFDSTRDGAPTATDMKSEWHDIINTRLRDGCTSTESVNRFIPGCGFPLKAWRVSGEQGQMPSCQDVDSTTPPLGTTDVICYPSNGVSSAIFFPSEGSCQNPVYSR